MPNPVSVAQTVQAINTVLGTLEPKGDPIENLDSAAKSNSAWSCNVFSPDVLTQICEFTKTPTADLNSTEYASGDALPKTFADMTFANISMMGEPSALNHNFNILVSKNTIYLIQVFIRNNVRIVQPFPIDTFIANWHALSKKGGWVDSYKTLFGVTIAEPTAESWLKSQYVTQ